MATKSNAAPSRRTSTFSGRASGPASSNDAKLTAALRRARGRRAEGAPARRTERDLRQFDDLAVGMRPFDRYLKEWHARPVSMKTYRTKAVQVARVLVEAGISGAHFGAPPEEFPWHFVTPETAARFFAIVSERYPNPKTRANLVCVVRTLTKECARAKLILPTTREEILAALPVPFGPQRGSGRALEPGEAARLLAAESTGGRRLNVRDTAAIALLLSTGLRISEVVELEVGDVTFDERGARVDVRRTKAGRPHTAWLNTEASAYVMDWLELRGSHGGALFESRAGSGEALFAGSLAQRIKVRAKAAGLSSRLSSHDFRRTFATTALRGGVDPFTVQRLLGHRLIQTTLVYDRRTELEDRAVVELLDIPLPVRLAK